MINFGVIESDNKEIIKLAVEYMSEMTDKEHGFGHMNDVVSNTKSIIQSLADQQIEVNRDVCIVSAYWHDVGRLCKNEGHEEISAEQLYTELKRLGYREAFAKSCYDTVGKHSWKCCPNTLEGNVLRDADKVAFVSLGRWSECLEVGQDLDIIVKMLPRIRNEILQLDVSRTLYDEQVVKLVQLLYSKL